jgi:hypothetical protein
MLDGRAGAGSDRLKSMDLVFLAFKSSLRPRKKSCMALKLIWRLVNSVQRRARCIQNGVVCVEVDQRITSSKSVIIDVYREKSRPRIEPFGTPIETSSGLYKLHSRSSRSIIIYSTLCSLYSISVYYTCWYRAHMTPNGSPQCQGVNPPLKLVHPTISTSTGVTKSETAIK